GWPLAARAQPDRIRRIGLLMGFAESDPEGQTLVTAFREGLQKPGWNIRIDTRWAAGDMEGMQRLAKELGALQPDLTLSGTTPTTAALLEQTRTIPRPPLYLSEWRRSPRLFTTAPISSPSLQHKCASRMAALS